MKKNININISGIIFYIEEDGYDRLKEYLLSIHRYFSSYEDSAEIIADIENRIAEIFLARLGENKQVITVEDIEDLVATMGSVADFQAVEEDVFAAKAQKTANQQTKSQKSANKEDFAYENQSKANQNTGSQYNYGGNEHTGFGKKEPKKLYRDNKRKLLSGVAAGIAHYLGLDPLWIRLMFLATIFDWFFMISVSGVAFVVYIVCWATIPPSDDLEEDAKIKKLFRNPDNKVIGGVAGGLAAYFGVEVTVVRVLLALGMLLGGTTIIAYCILWAITPVAKTLTEKMQMEGEPITLRNIEEKVKENLNIGDNQEETLLAKVLLFPFRLIAQVISTLTSLLQPFGNFILQVLRIVLGLKFTFLGFVFIVAFTTVLFGILGSFGFFANKFIKMGGVPVTMIAEIVPQLGIYSSYVLLIIPAIALVLIGISLIAKRKIVSSIFAWALFGTWTVSLALATSVMPQVFKKFGHSETLEQALTFGSQKEAIVLDLLKGDENAIEWDEVTLTIKGYEGKEIKIIKHTTARGMSNEDALRNAQMLDYEIVQEKNRIVFDNGFSFGAESLFRGQSLKLEFLMPYNQEFVMTKDLRHILRNTVTPHGYRAKDVNEDNRWVYLEGKGLKCLTCEREKAEENNDEDDNSSKSFDYKDFNALKINSTADITIEQGEKFEILVDGNEVEENGIQISQNGKILTINAMVGHSADITIKMPKLVACEASGKCDVTIVDFKAETLSLTANDAVEIDAELDATKLICKLSGKANLRVKGKAQTGEFMLNDASELNAFDFELASANLQCDGASEAEIYADKLLNIATQGVSKALYKGKAKVTGKGNFEKEED
jgi:phage shock protein PspC (stress-responsive transcriptional regulator)